MSQKLGFRICLEYGEHRDSVHGEEGAGRPLSNGRALDDIQLALCHPHREIAYSEKAMMLAVR